MGTGRGIDFERTDWGRDWVYAAGRAVTVRLSDKPKEDPHLSVVETFWAIPEGEGEAGREKGREGERQGWRRKRGRKGRREEGRESDGVRDVASKEREVKRNQKG